MNFHHLLGIIRRRLSFLPYWYIIMCPATSVFWKQCAWLQSGSARESTHRPTSVFLTCSETCYMQRHKICSYENMITNLVLQPTTIWGYHMPQLTFPYSVYHYHIHSVKSTSYNKHTVPQALTDRVKLQGRFNWDTIFFLSKVLKNFKQQVLHVWWNEYGMSVDTTNL